MTAQPSQERLAWILLAWGMILRLVWAALVPVHFVSDSYAYHVFARTLLDHGVYGWTAQEPSAYWPVGTSALAALSYAVFGQNELAIELPNLIAAAVGIRMVWLIGRSWVGAEAALVATALMAFWPNLIMFTTVLASELPFIALTLLGTWLWTLGAWRGTLLAGLAWGVACFIRPVILLFPLALVPAGARRGLRGLALDAARAALAIVLIVAVVSPWSARNERLFGERVLVSTNFGPNFWMGNNPAATGGYMPLPPEVEGMSETARARHLSDEAKAHIRSHPVDFLRRTAVKAAMLHERETIGVAWNGVLAAALPGTVLLGLKLISTGWWYAVLAAALAGIVAGFRRQGWRQILDPALLAWGYFTALHAVTVVEDRYHMPSVPFIALLAATPLAALYRHRRNRQGTAAPRVAEA